MSSSCRPRFTKHPLVRAVQGALTGWAFASTGLLAPPVQAQAQAGPQSVKKRFDIPPSQLDYALSLLKTQSGVLLSVDPRLTHGKTTAGLHGDYTVAEAFAAVLADSGLELAAVSDAVYVLRERQEPAATAQRWVSAPVRVAEAEPQPVKPPEEPVQEESVQEEAVHSNRWWSPASRSTRASKRTRKKAPPSFRCPSAKHRNPFRSSPGMC